MRQRRVPMGWGKAAPLLADGARIMLLLFLSLAVSIFVIYEIMAVTHPYPLDYGEAPLVDQAMRLAAGQNIYRADVSTPPYTISNYPPGYVLVLTPFVKLFGPNFWAGRLISLLSSLAAGSCLALIVYEFSREKLAAWAAALLFWAIPYVVHWSTLLRIDLLALALSLAALTVLVRRPEGRRSLVVGAALLTAAIYTRQSYALAAPLAACVWLWTQGGWRRACTLAALVAGASLLLFLGLNLATGGGFYFNVVTANVNAFEMSRLGWNLSRIRDELPLLLLIGAASLFLTPGRTRSWSLAVPYLVGAFLSTLTIGKVGSNVNYFLELCAALSLTAGLAIAWSREHPWARSVLLVLLALQTGLLMQTTFDEYVGPLRERRQSLKLLRDLEWKVAHSAGPVLADEYMGILTLQGRPLYIQPFEMTQLSDAGLWDQTPFVESIRQGEFPLILIHYFPEYDVYKERWTPEMLSAISRSYSLDSSLADTRIYRPRLSSGGQLPVEKDACAGAPWRLPTSARLGVSWDGSTLDFLGRGNAGEVPIYAVADGRLTRLPEWVGAVAILHDDPLHPGQQVWSYYTGMVGSDGTTSYIAADFPPGSVDVPVPAGTLLGYQGTWSGTPAQPTWLHLHFAVVGAEEGGAFPDALLPETWEPAAYLGLALKEEGAYTELQPLRCAEPSP